jgi:HlyD family secretion protein
MYRIKLKIPQELLVRYREYVKAGLTGEAYVKLDGSKPWPPALATRLPDAR